MHLNYLHYFEIEILEHIFKPVGNSNQTILHKIDSLIEIIDKKLLFGCIFNYEFQ